MIFKRGTKTALIAGDARISYDELTDRVHALIQHTGMFSGNAAIIAENRPEWIVAYFGIIQAGGTAVPVDYLSSAEDIAYIIGDATPQIVFCSEQTIDKVREPAERVGARIVMMDAVERLAVTPGTQALAEPDPERVVTIIYTSGTTGSPKGVMLTADNFNANIESVTGSVPIYTEDGVVMVLLPLHHCFPLAGTMLGPLSVSSTLVFSPSLNGEDIVATMQRHGVTLLLGVPRLYHQILTNIRAKIRANPVARVLFVLLGIIGSKKLSRKVFKEVHAKFGGRIRYLVSGGAALGVKAAKDFATLGFDVLEGYGMTEAAPMITCCKPGLIKPGTVGTAIAATELAIMDGEICCRGRNVMKGYYKRPDATAEIIRDGWLHTGDLGAMDRDGFVTVTGRLKEILVLPNGKKINPEELEAEIVRSSEYVAECGVYLDGQTLAAVLVPNTARLAAKEIHNLYEYFKWDVVDRFNRSTSPYRKIMRFSLYDAELPRTRLGKLQRFRLPTLAEARQNRLAAEAEPDTEEYRSIKEFIESSGKGPVRASSHLEMDLGMDSLDKVSLASYIRTVFEVPMDDRQISALATPLKLAAYVKEHAGTVHRTTINWSDILKIRPDMKLPRSVFPHMTLRNLLKFFTVTFFRLRREGLENVGTGPVIIAANHQSFLDWAFIASSLPARTLRKTVVFAKKKHFRSWWRKWMASRSNIVLIDINNELQDSIRKMGEVLRKGYNLAIFPEGTRSRDGRIGEFKKTFSILSKELDVPVVPVVIKGAREAMPGGSWFIRPFRRIKVRFLKPVSPDGKGYEEFTDDVRSRVEREFDAM